MHTNLRSMLLIGVACVASSERCLAADPGVDFFERKIRPVLVERCYKCHSAESASIRGGLRLDSRDTARQGGESGRAIVPGRPEESLLLAALRYENFEMPPDGKLADEVLADFEKWIRMGAPDPREGTPMPVPTRTIDWNQARQFWSFQPPVRHAMPQVKQGEWLGGRVDAFILAQLEAAGLSPNRPADRQTLIRRVTFDLTGLPPAPDEVDYFLNDQDPGAYDRLVDRLLASPRTGERWARLWLDIARFAEDQAHIVGNNRELCYPNAYLYRDWVVTAFNADMPYDEFVRLQLAADQFDSEKPDTHVALGFLGLGPKYYRRNAPEVMADEWEDRVDTVTRGILGLSVACARCHDHKYDPIPTTDYYALAGIFASTEMYNRPLDEKTELDKNGHAKDAAAALHIVRDVESKNLPVHIRGDVTKTGPIVPRHYLTVLCASDPPVFNRGSGRRELAEAIVDRNNPLTARVIVNRVWGQFFGRPLVDTPSNFGALGERPSHPELLDDLAVRFMEAGWSLKWLQRELVSSATYQQSSDLDSAKSARDAANRLWWRMPRRRLSVESWRDALLMVAGRLDRRLGGPSIDPQDPDLRRRTLYSEVSRLELDSLLAMFDFPDPNAHSERRSETTTPLQKLFVLNSEFMLRQAESLADRVTAVAGDDEARLTAAYRLVFSRPPTSQERALGLEFLKNCEDLQPSPWVQLAQVLLASNEMLIVD